MSDRSSTSLALQLLTIVALGDIVFQIRSSDVIVPGSFWSSLGFGDSAEAFVADYQCLYFI
jgi:hypothetical protein